ncbi:hypothetical protein ACIRD2_02140 [Streptomyces sp. NPDC093595]|uniref:hypothetical protein n=1 Tax=Streptomyces sp. NPDC093595 TaxID=3366045 RepID=UPI003829448F
MSRKKTLGAKKKIALFAGAAALVGGTAVVMTGTSQASVACDGLATALSNNEKFIAGQRANPDAQSEARIANRQAVIEQIKRQQAASGCEVGQGGAGQGGADQAAGGNGGAGQAAGGNGGAGQAPGGNGGAGQAAGGNAGNGGADQAAGGNAGNGGADQAAGGNAGNGGADQAAGGNGGGQGGAAGEVVCAGSTVTLSGEGGAPAASSNQFPVGTRLKVTNLDNNKSTTVEVTSVSGSCALLNNAAFEQVREPGKFLIRKARIERVG